MGIGNTLLSQHPTMASHVVPDLNNRPEDYRKPTRIEDKR
jgi:hypothetical protein